MDTEVDTCGLQDAPRIIRMLISSHSPTVALEPTPALAGTVGHRLAKQKLELNEIIIRDLKR